MFGLKDEDISTITGIIAQYGEVEKAFIFGSRAKGNYRNGSDVDIALQGKKISLETISGISYVLNEETLMPYHFDVLNYHTLNNPDLIHHIDRVGICFYEKPFHYDLNQLYAGQVSEDNQSIDLNISIPDKDNSK